VIRRRAALIFPVRQRAQPVGDVDFADRRVDGRREAACERIFPVSTARAGVVVVSVIAGLQPLLLLVL
jgi:hypothetical protein